MEPIISRAFDLVIFLSKKFNIDESHSLKHSMEVYNFALRIYESELEMNQYLHSQKDIIILAAILHDTIDKKYVDEQTGLEEIRKYMEHHVSVEKLDIIFKIITTMSYSTVKKNGFPLLNEYQLAYHIVREADLLAAYDIDRCIIYAMYKKGMNYTEGVNAATSLFEDRVFKHKSDKLFVTNYSKRVSMQLHKKAKKDVEILSKYIV